MHAQEQPLENVQVLRLASSLPYGQQCGTQDLSVGHATGFLYMF